MTGPVRWGAVALLVGAAFAVGRCSGPEPDPPHPAVEVPPESIERDEPELEPGIIDRIVERPVQPEQVATAPGGGEEQLVTFCTPYVQRAAREAAAAAGAPPAVGGLAALQVPRVPDPAPVFLARSSRSSPGLWGMRDRTTLVGITSTGELREIRFVAWPGSSWRSDDAGGVSIREPRFGGLRGWAIELGVPLAVGAAIGGLLVR